MQQVFASMTGDGSGLTWRAVLAGSAIGTLMCFSNMYFGLQTGWVTMASLQSALLAHGLWALCVRVRGAGCSPLTVAEHVLVTSVATAAATMPLAAGFVGIIPALRILHARGEGAAGCAAKGTAL
jgi:uncharacterized oligopeptide transporter (OPT) family protein